MNSIKFLSFVLFLNFYNANASEKCVWASGFVRCELNPSKQVNVQMTLYDRDGRWILQTIDKDDKMDITFTDHDGKFYLSGCARDVDWIFLHKNHPDPYMLIEHNCNWNGEMTKFRIEMPKRFMPDSYDAGLIILDSHRQITDHREIERYQDNEGSGQIVNF